MTSYAIVNSVGNATLMHLKCAYGHLLYAAIKRYMFEDATQARARVNLRMHGRFIYYADSTVAPYLS